MNGRERLLATLGGQPVDRVAIAPFLYFNSVYELFGYVPDIDNFSDPPDFDPIVKFVEYCDYFGFDVMHNLGSDWGFYMFRPCDNWDVRIAEERRGDEKQRTITIRTPEGDLRHVENYRRSSRYLVVSAPEEYLVKSPRDFEILRKYAPTPDLLDARLVRRAAQAVGDKGLVASNAGGVFNMLNAWRKLDDVMSDPLTDEGFYREMAAYARDCAIGAMQVMIANGADLIEMTGNLATSAVGPRYYRKYVLDYEKQVIDAVHAAGALVNYHNCGDAARIMHLYNEMGMDCWGYLTPPPFGDVDLDEALRVIRRDMALRGNIDQVEFMVRATPRQVNDRVRDLLLKVKPRGNWILSTTDFLFDGTPYENIRAFTAAGMAYGQY